MINRIKMIPILDVADRLQINHKKGKANTLCFKGHDKNTSSLSFDIPENKFKCFGCGICGDGMDLVADKLGLEFADVLAWFNTNFDVALDYSPLKGMTLKSVLSEEEKEVVQNEKVCDIRFLYDQNIISRAYTNFCVFFPLSQDDYFLKERGISNEIVKENMIFKIDHESLKKFVIGKIPFPSDQGIFYDFLWLLFTDLGVEDDIEGYIDASGLMSLHRSSYGIPFYEGSKIRNIQGVNTGDRRNNYSKYAYLKNIKKQLIYIPCSIQNADGTIKSTVKDVFVTEGIIDCLSLIRLGMNSIALIDSSVHEDDERFEEFKLFFDKTIYLILDNDNPGEKAKQIIAEWLSVRFYEARARDLQDIANSIGVKDFVKDSNDLLLKLIKDGHEL